MDKADLSQRLRSSAAKIGGGNELSRRTGIPRRTIENYLSGKTDVKTANLQEIADAAGVSVEWLATGRDASYGERFAERLNQIAEKLGGADALAQKTGIHPDNLSDYLSGMRTPPANSVVSIAHAGGVPLEWLMTGNGAMDASPSFSIYARIAEKHGVDVDALEIVTIESEAMSPTIRIGETVIASTDPKHKTLGDGVYWIYIEGEAQIKRLQRLPEKKVKVMSDNPVYGAFEIDQAKLTIKGKVLTILARDL